jgi:HNH endonuclease
MFTIANTDHRWFDQLRATLSDFEVNFWSPTPWNVRSIDAGSRLYFMLKHPIRLIGGYGIFRGYETLRVSEAWRRFGKGNGVSSADELRDRVEGYANKRSANFQPASDREIGCLMLSDPVLFDDQYFLDPSRFGVEFPRQVVKFKTFDEPDPFAQAWDFLNREPDFDLVIGEAAKATSERKQRLGQAQFRRLVLDAYGSRCCVSGTNVEAVIQAAHIQPYVSSASNHVQNGLPLRSDLHTLFDNGLLGVGPDHVLLVSSRLDGTEYERYRGKRLLLPLNPVTRPSEAALELHRNAIFRSD